MNKIIAFICALLCLSASAQDSLNKNSSAGMPKLPKQPRFYLNVHGGYSIALGSTFKFYADDVSQINVTKIYSDPTSKTVKYQAVSKGLGEGFRFGIGGSYIINDFINVGLDVDYFKSTISRHRDSSYYEINSNPNPQVNERAYNERRTTSYKTELLTFTPNITFKAISRPNFFIYNKIGAVFTFRPNSLQKEKLTGTRRLGWQGFYQDSSFTSQTKYSWGIRNPSFGFMGGVGIQVKLQERVRGFAEVQFTHIVFRTRSRTLTSLMVNGAEMADDLTVSQREIRFRKDFTDDQSGQDPNTPTNAVVQRFPISYVGLQLGVAYRF
jgi:hypothetical protein